MKKTDCENLDIIVGSKERVSELIAEHIAAQMMKNGGKITLGAAGGSSTSGAYEALANIVKLSGVTVFAADEYFGTMDQFKNIEKQLPGAMVHAPDAVFNFIGNKREWYESMLDRTQWDAESEHTAKELIEATNNSCERYENLMKEKGGIDILLLGIGRDPDGHIASIMPGQLDINGRTYLVRYPAPHKISVGITNYGITMGLGAILKAKEIVLIAFGEEKANIVERALYGPINGECPASFARKSQNKVKLCLDHGSAKYI